MILVKELEALKEKTGRKYVIRKDLDTGLVQLIVGDRRAPVTNWVTEQALINYMNERRT